MTDPAEKKCCGCKRMLPFTAFHRNATKLDGLQFECKSCVALRSKARRKRRADARCGASGYDVYLERLRAENRAFNRAVAAVFAPLYRPTIRGEHA